MPVMAIVLLLWLVTSIIGAFILSAGGSYNETIKETIDRNLKNGYQVKHVFLTIMIIPLLGSGLVIYVVYWVFKGIRLFVWNKYSKRVLNFTLVKPKGKYKKQSYFIRR